MEQRSHKQEEGQAHRTPCRGGGAAAPGKRKKKRDDLNALLGHHLASRPKNAFAVVDAAAIARLGAERAAGKRPRPEAQATKKRNKRRRG